VSIFSRYAAVLGSLALHGVAIAWVQTHPATPEVPVSALSKPSIEIVSVIPAEPDPMVVALLPDHSVAPPTPAPDRVSSSRLAHASNPTIGPKVETSTTVTPPTQPETPQQRNPLMTMRHDEKPKLDNGVSEDFTETFLRNTKPIKPNENPTLQTQVQLAIADGNLKNSRWVANATPDELTAMRMEAASMRDELNNRELQPDGTGRKAEHQTFTVKVAADGSAKIHDKANLQRKGLGASFDVTDALMRNQGMDPYSSYKLKVLDETREERVAMGKVHRTQQLAMSKQHMQKNLERLWAMTTDLAKRKQGLFDLWDDCAETGTEELVAGGKSAREHVVGFIRSKLPAGSELAFSETELAKLNRSKKSQATFAPYL